MNYYKVNYTLKPTNQGYTIHNPMRCAVYPLELDPSEAYNYLSNELTDYYKTKVPKNETCIVTITDFNILKY